MKRRDFDDDVEGPRLRALATEMTASLPSGPKRWKVRDPARVRALVELDALRIAQERAEGVLVVEGRTITLHPPKRTVG